MKVDSYRASIVISIFSMLLWAVNVTAQGHPSARVYALGGSSFTGIVRDTLTDIYLSPTFLAACDRLTINYGQRQSPALHLCFPMPAKGSSFNSIADPWYYRHIGSARSSEVVLYGIAVGAWRLAGSAEWRYSHSEESSPNARYSSIGSFNPTQYMELETRTRGSRYVRGILSAARELSSGYRLGIRVGGSNSASEDGYIDTESYYSIDTYSDPYDLVPDYRRYNYRDQGAVLYSTQAYGQMGLLREGPEGLWGIDGRIARNDIYAKIERREVHSFTEYDMAGNPDEYEREEIAWRDERSGALWSYDLFIRRAPASGLRLFAGVGFEHMGYETVWRDRASLHSWIYNAYSDSDTRAAMVFDGEGDCTGLSAFLKMGTARRLSDEIELTIGLNASARRRWTEERPTARISYYMLENGSSLSFSTEKPIDITTDRFDASITVPLAIEFEPARWVSIWSGFSVGAAYERFDDVVPELDALSFDNIASYLDLELFPTHCWIFRRDDIEAVYTATVGASLHYEDRLYVDIYTGSDLTPDNLINYILDVRYAF